ncbi:MAG: thiamine pyrophosphate-binding protein [Gammaproteobacteria bacterium]|nr:thiamine pyrophosphate-binding protein [Gammaproteobacteria bacterium]MDH3413242.1 thiamine pyrophosphate-binding protein [Gammaproteobacteria bacterium]
MTNEAKPRVYDVLAKAFIQEGVSTCFALLGDANMNWAARLAQQGCRMVYVRHEHCAVAAAMSYARKTSEVGVATVTCGPGVTQVITALPAAVRAHLPLVVFAGEAPLRSGWYNQGIDQAPLITATGAAYHSLHLPERMPVAIRDAFLQARRERRPVVIGIPFDLQGRPWDGPEKLPTPSRQLLPRPSPIPPHPDDVASAAQLVAGAERVVVFAGLGAVEAKAGAACQALAAKTGGLLSTTLPARGLFHDDAFCIGIAGSFTPEVGLEYLAQADLIIAVGGSLAYHAGGGGQLWPKAKTLQIDINPVAMSQGQEVARHHLRADARLGVEALTAALPARTTMWRNESMAARIRDSKPDSHVFEIEPGLLDPRDAVEALEKALPADWELVNSSGHCSWFFAQMPSRPQERFLTIREFGAIGNGISFAMGVAAARPDRTVVLFDGDGSLIMHVQELETIKRHRMNILIVVMNDGAYGSEVHKFRAEGMPEDGSVFGRCDFAAIARSFGLHGKTFKSLDDLPKLLEEFAASGGAAIWDFHVSDRVVSPTIRRAHPPGKHRKA